MKGREKYDADMALARAIPSAVSRRAMIEHIIDRMRRDKGIKPLVLCAFLQDHAKIIKELLQ